MPPLGQNLLVRRHPQLWLAVAGVVVVASLAGVAAVMLPGRPAAAGRQPGRHTPAARHQNSRGPAAAASIPTTLPSTTTPTSPGALPQTATLPSAGSAGFRSEMLALWRGVETGTVGPAMGAFFPEGAYLQVKTITDPAADFEGRLVAQFAADIAAAHAVVAAAPGPAQLVGVQVPEQYVHWVTPGTCFNAVGYYEVPNARVVYRQGGMIRSFGIASMISWRGSWYVVHLGAVLQQSDVGVVDDPSVGTGVSAPYVTC